MKVLFYLHLATSVSEVIEVVNDTGEFDLPQIQPEQRNQSQLFYISSLTFLQIYQHNMGVGNPNKQAHQRLTNQ